MRVRRIPALTASVLTLATLACASVVATPVVVAPTGVPPYDGTLIATAIIEPTRPPLPTAIPATDTSVPDAGPTATTAPDGPASIDRFWEETSSKTDATDPVTYTIELNVPVLRASDPTDAATAGFNAVVQKNVDQLTTGFVSDLEQYPPDPAFTGGMASFFQIGATRFTLSPRIVSVRLDVGGYVAGAAHPYSFSRTINFDLQANREVHLSDLFTPGVDYLKLISDYCIAELQKTDFFAGFETGADPTELNYQNWNLTPDGLLVNFDPYQVGPYAAGPQQITVPYATLAEWLDHAGPAGEFVP